MSDKTRKAIADRIKRKSELTFKPTKKQQDKAKVTITKEPKST